MNKLLVLVKGEIWHRKRVMHDFDSPQDGKDIISIKNPSIPSMLLRLWLEMLSDTATQILSGPFAAIV